MRRPNLRSGFTLIEILFVVMVLAILALLAYSAYLNARQRGITATVQSDLKTAALQLEKEKVETGVYPTSAGSLKSSPNTVYQYTTPPSLDSYCLTANSGITTFYIRNGSTTPIGGPCAGHLAGGTAPITNLMRDPSVTLASNLSFSIMNNGGFVGDTYGRRTYIGTALTGVFRNDLTLVGDETYTFSAWMRASKSVSLSACLQWRTSLGTQAGPTTCGSSTTIGTGWSRISVTGTAPATTSGNGSLIVIDAATSIFSLNDTLDIDAMMLTTGNGLYNYADGSSPGWVWSNPTYPTVSTSSGPAL